MIPTFDARDTTGDIQVAGIALPRLFDKVMTEGAAVVRGVFDPDLLVRVRGSIHAWGQRTEAMPPQTYIDENFHGVESGISPRQKTVHCYHGYNFNQIRALDADVRDGLLPMFERLSDFQNRLTGQGGAFEPDAAGRKQRPQVIHYPSGGGIFGRHVHPLEPQRIGLILGLSKRGRDFASGSTWFEMDGRRFGSDDCHDIGDLILFRFDIPHWITAIDQGEKFDPASERGRWTAVLPFY